MMAIGGRGCFRLDMLILLALMALPSATFAVSFGPQSYQGEKITYKTEFFDVGFLAVKRQVPYNSRHQKHGLEWEFTLSSEHQTYGSKKHVIPWKHGKKDGEEKIYSITFFSGETYLQEVRHWKNGVLHGKSIKYYKESRARPVKVREVVYYNGKIDGKGKIYDDGGAVAGYVFEDNDGNVVEERYYNPAYKNLFSWKKTSKDSRGHEKKQYYQNGKLAYHALTGDDGFEKFVYFYNKSGAFKKKIKYSNCKPSNPKRTFEYRCDALSLQYDENGNLLKRHRRYGEKPGVRGPRKIEKFDVDTNALMVTVTRPGKGVEIVEVNEGGRHAYTIESRSVDGSKNVTVFAIKNGQKTKLGEAAAAQVVRDSEAY